ncbi:MAG TPA: ABC transporter permease, partial [Alcaligenaceae bacterium]|nr:ABC transporter permease [Alcaligenaceae bacterium]
MSRFKQSIATIYNLGIKEFYSLGRDVALVVLIIFMFSGVIYSNSKAKPDSLNKATIAVLDEDQSALSSRLIDALHEPYFLPPRIISRDQIDAGMDAGLDTFVLNIPPNFERDVQAGKNPALQLNVDATRQSQAL